MTSRPYRHAARADLEELVDHQAEVIKRQRAELNRKAGEIEKLRAMVTSPSDEEKSE